MKKLIFLLPVFALAQTNLGTPVTVLPKSDGSAAGILRLRDSAVTPHYISFQTVASLGVNVTYSIDQLGFVNLPSHGLIVAPNPANTFGAYQIFRPLTYNPHLGSPCTDQWGNVVTQPLPVTGDSFGADDILLWNSTSPVMPSSGSCGTALAISGINGLNTNAYFYSQAGFGTESPYYNSVQSLLGGMYAMTGFTTFGVVMLGQNSTPGTLLTCTNPFSSGVNNCPYQPGGAYKSIPFGGLAHISGSIYSYLNSTTGVWHNIDLSTTWTAGSGGAIYYNNGNVGIGTAIPSQRFTLSSGSILLDDLWGILWGGASTYISGSSASNYLSMSTNSLERLRIVSNGSVLIGASSDDGSGALLQVTGDASVHAITAATQFQSKQTTASLAFSTNNGNFQVDGLGNISIAGTGSIINVNGSTGGVNIVYNTAAQSIQSVGGIKASQGYNVGTYGGSTTQVINSSGQWVGSAIYSAGTNIGISSGTISTSATPSFTSVQTTSTTSTLSFSTANGNFQVDGLGNISIAGAGSVIAINGSTGGLNITADVAYNSIQSVGGAYFNLGSYNTVGLTIKAAGYQNVDLIQIFDHSNNKIVSVGSAGTVNAPGFNMNSTGGITVSGSSGVTSATCTQWTYGICTHS